MTRSAPWSCLLAALISLTCCSCKTMPTPTGAAPQAGAERASIESSGVEPRAASAAPAGREPSGAKPSGVRQVAHFQEAPAAGNLAPIVDAVPGAAAPSPAPAAAPHPAAAMPLSAGPASPLPMAAGQTAGPDYHWAPAGGCGPACNCGPGAGVFPTRPGFIAPDEYLCDGGDTKALTIVDDNFNVRNIDMTDTVGHYDTLDGQRIVEQSNRVCIYAPRFAAVRRIDKPVSDDVLRAAAGVDTQRGLSSQDHHALVGSLLQPQAPEGQLGAKAANALLERDRGLTYQNTYAPSGASNPLPAWENFEIIQRGVYLNTEKPRLQEHVDAALTWMTSDSVEVMIGQRRAQLIESEKRPQETVMYEMDGKPRLRICKVASTDNAQPGEIVEFTIRFDNIGDQRMGNVTILDSLTTRLEYIEDSQQCSVKADFLSVVNEGESLVLRWEIIDPLKVGEGGVIRFKCRVR